MKIIYISTSCPLLDAEVLNKRLKHKMQVSSNKYHNSLIEGLVENNQYIYSIYALPITNKLSNKIFWKEKCKLNKKSNYLQLGFVNLPIIKYITINFNLNKKIKKIIKDNNNEKIIILFDGAFVSIYPTLKKYIKLIPTYAIIADVYEYMADVKNSSKYKKIIVNNVKKYIKKINKFIKGYVFLNENMNELYNSDNYVVVEGIVSNLIKKGIECKINKKNKSKKIILYAGGLLEKFGIKNLINAFKLIENSNYELHLYGYTDIEDYILSAEHSDKRIKYFGMKETEIVYEAEKNATLLVNPRPTNYEFQKYSFPSKLIEYMASGTPVVTTKIDGMPKEYDKYLFYFDDYSVKGLKIKIEEILNIDNQLLNELGKNALKFIKINKSKKKQAKKVLKMVSNNEN